MVNKYFKNKAMWKMAFFFFVGINALAQTNKPSKFVRCHTVNYEKHLQEKNANRANIHEFENWITEQISAEKKAGRLANSTTILKIPVVVHVIHNGDAYGVNENIKDEQVKSQITVMNQDFRRMLNTPGFNENAVGADVQVEFFLATEDPKGNPSTGIDRVNLGVEFFDEAGVETNLKPSTIWNPDKYLNMWTCVFGGDLDGVLGYAQFPSNSGLSGLDANGGESNTDGVIASFDTFGSSSVFPKGIYNAPYDKGRTMTHEVGHWLGLRHIWGDGEDCATNNDYCKDTPVAVGANYGCPTGLDSCANDVGLDMIQNYMDYTNDACMNVFTNDQKTRIRTVLANSPRRKTLYTIAVEEVPVEVSVKDVVFFPNPANNEINLSLPKGLGKIDKYSIVNSFGQVVLSKDNLKDEDLKFYIDHLQNGIYYLKIEKGSDKKVLRIVKK